MNFFKPHGNVMSENYNDRYRVSSFIWERFAAWVSAMMQMNLKDFDAHK